MTVDKIINDKNFIGFVNKVKYFCSFLESYQSNDYKAFLSSIQKQLIELYAYGMVLPEFDLSQKDIDEVDITDNDIKSISSSIKNGIPDPFYWAVFDPTDHNDTTTCCGDLVDDLGDTYKDLKTFLIGFSDEDDDVKQNALWHLKWSFDNHWNGHCISAIYAIHYFLKQANPPSSTP